MAVIVEDGTGLSTAQTYISVEDANTYHNQRGNSAWSAAGTTEREAALIQAADYLDGKYGRRWIGDRSSSAQALDWPRDYAYDELGELYDPIPTKLAQATAVVALKIIEGADVSPDLERGGKVQSESLGSIATTYAQGATPLTVYTGVVRLLAGLVRSGGLKVVR